MRRRHGEGVCVGGRLSDVCSQQKPGLQGIQTVVQRLRGGCLQPPPSHCLHSLARRVALDGWCGCAVRLCVRLCGCAALRDGCRTGAGRVQDGCRMGAGWVQGGECGRGQVEVRLQKPQHVSRQGESERFPLHSFRHRPG